VSSFARIHAANLVNFGILPLEFATAADAESVEQGDVLWLVALREALSQGRPLSITNVTKGTTVAVRHALTERQVDVILAGGLLNYFRDQARA